MGIFASHPPVFREKLVSVDSTGYIVYCRRFLRAGKFKRVKKTKKN